MKDLVWLHSGVNEIHYGATEEEAKARAERNIVEVFTLLRKTKKSVSFSLFSQWIDRKKKKPPKDNLIFIFQPDAEQQQLIAEFDNKKKIWFEHQSENRTKLQFRYWSPLI